MVEWFTYFCIFWVLLALLGTVSLVLRTVGQYLLFLLQFGIWVVRLRIYCSHWIEVHWFLFVRWFSFSLLLGVLFWAIKSVRCRFWSFVLLWGWFFRLFLIFLRKSFFVAIRFLVQVLALILVFGFFKSRIWRVGTVFVSKTLFFVGIPGFFFVLVLLKRFIFGILKIGLVSASLLLEFVKSVFGWFLRSNLRNFTLESTEELFSTLFNRLISWKKLVFEVKMIKISALKVIFSHLFSNSRLNHWISSKERGKLVFKAENEPFT